MRNILLTISFDGTNYSGWQRQKNTPTIQGEIEFALKRLTQQEVSLHGAGRTDAGVHAAGMTAHFTTDCRLSTHDIQRALNSILPGAIRILNACQVENSFHSRFSAKGKEYHYTLFTGQILPPEKRLYMLHQRAPLNAENMTKCLQTITGSHDFSSFENSGSRDKTRTTGRGAVRTITYASYQQIDSDISRFIFIGDGFLRNMVRNLVGSILEVGRDKHTSRWFQNVLETKDRGAAGPTALAHGLQLHKVFY